MGLGYFPVVPILLLLESAQRTGGARSTTSPPTSSASRLSASVADTASGTETTTPAAETNKYLPSSVALLYETTTAWNTVGETSLPGVATTLPSSSSPEASTPVGTSELSPSSPSLETASISSTGFGLPSEKRTTHPAESTMLSNGSTTEEMNSSPPSPQDERTSEVPSTIISIPSQEVSTSEKLPSSPSFTETMKTSPLLVPLSTPRVETSTLLSAPSGVGDTTREVTTSSEAEITSWWPGSSPSSTFSLVTQDRSTSKVMSIGLLSSNPGKTSLGLPALPFPNPTSENSTTTFKVLSSSASKARPKTPARTRFILSVRLSTSLNITDPSVTHAVRKWFNQELHAKFPVSSFNLTWIG